MSDEKPKPTPRFGSIHNQFETIGGGQEKRTDDMQQAALTQERQDVKTSEQMERQTVWMPHGLRVRLKAYAALHEDDISGIITRLVETFLDEAERGRQ